MKRKGRIILSIVLAVVIALTALFVVFYRRAEQAKQLEEQRNAALEELERNIGTYDDQSIVLYQTSKANAEELASLLGAELRITKDGRFAKLTLPEGTTIRDVYADDANLEHIEKMAADYQVHIADITEEENVSEERLPTRPKYTVSDSDYALQTYLDYLNMQDVWNYYNGSGVTVAVIDTGIDTDHPEFSGRISEYSYNATEDKIVKDWTDENGNYDWSLIEDEQGHGTAVTGVLAASMNGEGIVGIAPDVNIIVIKAECDENGTFKRTSDLVFGLYYAIERDVQVVNMSFGTYTNINPFGAATQLAIDSDIVCVAASGNDGTSALSWPAADPNVIGVGALAADSWELADYSNYGENTNLVAPGTTYTAQAGGGYGTMDGTSLSAPLVAGAVALFMQNNPYIMVEDVTEVLYASSCDLGDLGRDWTYGFGALDMYAFLQEERGTIIFDMLTDELENTEALFVKGHTLQEMLEPERLYAVFDGWYYDDTFTQEYIYCEDKFYDDITLYAKWVNEDDGVPFTYVELEDGTIEISSYTGRRRYITIPEKIDGKIVSSIGEFAFAGQTRLREVGLPSGLAVIKRYAFQGCSNLVSMYIPENVTSIEEYAFTENVRLSTLAFTGVSKLKTVRDYAFSRCNFRTLELPATLESINATAFLGDNALHEIKVQAGNVNFSSPDGVLYNATQSVLVSYPAARGRNYALPEQTRTIANYAFAHAQIDEVDLNQVQTIGEYAFSNSTLEFLLLPDTVVSLGKEGFSGNVELSDVYIGSGLTTISNGAFAHCDLLREIQIPEQVVSIGDDAFAYSGLRRIEFNENSKLTCIGIGAFFDCSIQEMRIPDSVTEIKPYAFSGTIVGNPLTRIAFSENSDLCKIGAYAFEKCNYLSEVILPNRLEVIEQQAFSKTAIKTINLPASVITLGDGAFAYCSALSDIVVETGNTVYHDLDGIVYTLDNTTICAFPAGKNINTYSINEIVRTISPYSFAGTIYLSHVSIPEGLSVISEYAFVECSASSYTLPSTLTNIMQYAFYGNGKLEFIQFPIDLERIAESAFACCNSLSYVHIPDNVLQIDKCAFANDLGLHSIIFGENSRLQRLSFGAFADTGLYSFTVPASVSTIAQGAFLNCSTLSSITFAENSKLESLSAYMFNGCSNLQSITFLPGSKLTSIQAHGLEGMDQLTSIDFGDAKLENIDNFAFRFCERLSTLNLPNTVKNVGRYAFYACKSLSELSLPETLEHIGSYAFLGTNDLDLYLASETMPAYLDENWDHGIRGYYTGVTNVETSGDYKYATLTSGNIAIIEYLGTDKTVDLTTVNLGAPISVIGGSAFKDSTVESIVLPETLTSIQAEAFQYAPLKNVIIPASVTFIGREAFAHTDVENLTFAEDSTLTVIEQYAFESTDKLTSVSIPASVTTLGTGVFQKSGLTSVIFADGIHLEEIPQNAFMGTKLTTVTLPDSVKTVNHNAFRDILTLKSVNFGNSDGIRLLSNVFYNTGLESLHIPANVTFIGEYCFVGLESLATITVDENNPNYKSVDGLLLTKSGRKLVTVPAGRTGSLAVPISVEEIGFGAFENTALDEILFDPNANILTFGYRAFFGAKNLTAIHIPASVVSIDYYAFAYCEKLQTVTFSDGNKLKGIYEGAFCGDINLENITVPDTIVEISDFAFYGCSKITKLPVSDTQNLKGIYDYAFAYTSIGGEFTAPETLVDIGSYSFTGTKITELTIPDTNKKDLVIGLGAFEECTQLAEATLPFIGASYEDDELSWFSYIFGAGSYTSSQIYVPKSLKTVTITEGITFVGVGGFAECVSLETINIPHSVSVLYFEAFAKTTAVYELTNRIETYSLFGAAEAIIGHFGSGITGTVMLSEPVECIYDAFEECSQLSAIGIPKTTRVIRDHFGSSLTKVYIEDLESWCEIVYYQGDAFTEIYDLYLNGSLLENVTIPESVANIESSAFYNCGSIRTLTIGNGVRRVSVNAFKNCINLEEITFGENVEIVLAEAFAGCSKLETVQLPGNIIQIDSSFRDCINLKSVIIEEGVQDIDGAFYGCISLRSVQVPQSVNSMIGTFCRCSNLETVNIPEGISDLSSTFYECTSLRTIQIPQNVTNLDSAFYGCAALQEIEIPEGVKQMNSAFWNCSNLLSANVPSTVTEGMEAFYLCDSLETVSIAEGLSAIDTSMFAHCDSLGEVVIPNSVSYIESMAFESCDSLFKVTLGEKLQAIGWYAFNGCHGLCYIVNNSALELERGSFDNGYVALFATFITDKDDNIVLGDRYVYWEDPATDEPYLLQKVDDYWITINGKYTEIPYLMVAYLGNSDTIVLPTTIDDCLYVPRHMRGGRNIVFPGELEFVDQLAFEHNGTLRSIVVSEGIKYIGASAFYGCTNLESISLPQTLRSIGMGAFSQCESLEGISLPQGITLLPFDLFNGCTNLTTVAIPSTVSTIEAQVFAGCSALTNIQISKNNPYFSARENFICDAQGTTILFPVNDTKELIIPEGILHIGDGAFSGSDTLETIVLPDSLLSIGAWAFSGCSSITHLELPDGLQSIGYESFANCYNLQSINFPGELTEIPERAFCNCVPLKRIVLPDGIKTIGRDAFLDCRELSEIVLPDTLTRIDENAFARCGSLTSITIPESVSELNNPFGGCDSLTDIVFAGTAPKFMMQDGIVYNSARTKLIFATENIKPNLIVPYGITHIGPSAFAYNNTLISITISDTVVEIGEFAFWDALKLEMVILGKSVANIGVNAFSCPRLLHVTNYSSLLLTPGSYEHGVIAYLTPSIIQKNGENYLADGYVHWENPETGDVFLLREGSQWEMLAYLGDAEMVYLPDSIDGQMYDFSWLCGVRGVTFPASWTDLTYEMFMWTKGFEHIVIPDYVTVGQNAFSRFAGLECVELGNEVYIYDRAFADCKNLRIIKIKGEYIWYPNIFDGSNAICEVHVEDPFKWYGAIPSHYNLYCNGELITELTFSDPDKIGSYSNCASLLKVSFSAELMDCHISSFTNCINLSEIELLSDSLDVRPETFYNTAYYNDPSNWVNGQLFIDDYLCAISSDTKYLDHTFEGNVVRDLYTDTLKLKLAILSESTQLSDNVETIIWGKTGAPWEVYTIPPKTLKYLVLRNNFEHFEFIQWGNFRDIVIFVEGYENDLRWDELYPNWNADLKVYYQDQWSWTDFYDANGVLIKSEPRLNSKVIVRPYISDYMENDAYYQLIGWDLDGDGLTDGIPATSPFAIKAYAIYEVTYLCDALGHTWSEWYDTTPGKEERSCATCGETESRDKIPNYDVDGNGIVEQADVTMLMSVLVGNTETDAVFDFDFDGELTIYDCVLLMQQIS